MLPVPAFVIGALPSSEPNTSKLLVLNSVVAELPLSVKLPNSVTLLPPWIPSAVAPAPTVTDARAVFVAVAPRTALPATVTGFWK